VIPSNAACFNIQGDDIINLIAIMIWLDRLYSVNLPISNGNNSFVMTKKYKQKYEPAESTEELFRKVGEALSSYQESGEWITSNENFMILRELYSRKDSAELLERLLKVSGLTKIMLAQLLEISPKTLNTYFIKGKKIPVRITEHILRLTILFEKGIELFDTEENLTQWMHSPSYGLGRMQPFSLINSIAGVELVRDELFRIEFGATA